MPRRTDPDPPMLFMGDQPYSEIDECQPDSIFKWHLIHVKSRQERAFADELQQARVAYFLPMYDLFGGSKPIRSTQVLFPGYVFLYCSPIQLYWSFRTNRIVQRIAIKDQQPTIQELSSLYGALSADTEVQVFPRLPIGHPVQIHKGQLAGIFGIVENVRDDGKLAGSVRVFIRVSMLGQSVTVDVPRAHVMELTPLDESDIQRRIRHQSVVR